MISGTAIIFPNIILGKNITIEDFVIIGRNEKTSPTVIGENGLIRSHTVIYDGNIIGSDFNTGHHVLIRESNIIGDFVSIGSNTVIEHHIKMGNHVRIHSSAFIPEETIIEDNVWIGPNVVITNAKYPLSPNVKKELKGATLRKNVKIGANCTLLPGVEIGENSLIGAGSLVTKNIPANKVAFGNPAIIVKDISELPYKI